jgi:hypothetical protein
LVYKNKKRGAGFQGFISNKKDSSGFLISNYAPIQEINPSGFSYCEMPSKQTLLSLISPYSSFSNIGNAASQYSLNFIANPISNNFFTSYSRVRIIDGDGSADSLDWVIFNFGIANGGVAGDWDNATGVPHFGGETITSKYPFANGSIWGFNSSFGWKLLFNLGASSSSYSRGYSYWYSSGDTTISGVGKRAEYDSLQITHLGFSVTI